MDIATLAAKNEAHQVIPENEVEAALLAVLEQEPIHIDEIRSRAELSMREVSATLTLMELKGLVRNVGSMRYVLVR